MIGYNLRAAAAAAAGRYQQPMVGPPPPAPPVMQMPYPPIPSPAPMGSATMSPTPTPMGSANPAGQSPAGQYPAGQYPPGSYPTTQYYQGAQYTGTQPGAPVPSIEGGQGGLAKLEKPSIWMRGKALYAKYPFLSSVTVALGLGALAIVLALMMKPKLVMSTPASPIETPSVSGLKVFGVGIGVAVLTLAGIAAYKWSQERKNADYVDGNNMFGGGGMDGRMETPKAPTDVYNASQKRPQWN